MPRARKYSQELLDRGARLVFESGRPIAHVARDLGIEGIGMLLDDGNGLDDVVGSPDGIAVVRPKPEMAEDFPIGWLFETLRSEPCRLQLWTESGGTSYGKLTLEHVRNVHLPVPRKAQRLASEERVREWADVSRALFAAWYRLGAPEDRVAIVNSPLIGLQEDDS
jgi:type I restriction enzyme M protein